VHVQNIRDFPQTKLDGEINSPFLLNEHGNSRMFSQVFAKNSLIKNTRHFKKKKFDNMEHDFFLENGSQLSVFGLREDFKLTTELFEKVRHSRN